LKLLNINPKFLPFNEVDSRYFIYTGGRGSGKSYAVAGALVYMSLTQNQTILFTRFTLRSASISIIPEFKDKLETMGISHWFKITRDEIINTITGSKILFRGIKTSSGDQTANLKSLQGITTWVMDEAEELVDESIFDKIDLSVREKQADNRVILILNPSTKEHWIYQRFFESKGIKAGESITKNDVTYIHSTYLDNIEHLSESYLSRIKEMKEHRPSKYKHQILGGWLEKAEGVIFTNWSLGEFKEVGKSVFGQDYGFSNDPTTLLQTSIDKNNKKIYIKLHFCQPGLTTSEINVLNKKFAGDSLIIGDSAEPRLINELARTCNMLPAIKGQGSVVFGISLLQDYDLIIDPDSIDLIKELNNYSWLEKKSQTPIDKFNHCIDAIRYAVSYQLENPTRGDYFIY
jgi:phage terminase large subunit